MPQIMVPPSPPRLSSSELRQRIAPFNIDRDLYPVLVIGIRGYYLNSMGAPGINDRGMYDDAIFIESQYVTAAFNGNTDPSRIKKGTGFNAGKGMAVLKPGIWFAHRFDQHNGKYLALCQRCGDVVVIRDGDPPYEDRGMFGINIHKGGYNTTSSLGCQTIHPSQWESFINLAVDQTKRYYGNDWRKKTIPYILLEN